MAQKPMLRVEVGALALRVRSVSREGAWASAGVQGAWVSGLVGGVCPAQLSEQYVRINSARCDAAVD